jgi:hypothetical protein
MNKYCEARLHKSMPVHGDYDKENDKVFCGYWMSPIEWEEIHKYQHQSEDMEVNSTEKIEIY